MLRSLLDISSLLAATAGVLLAVVVLWIGRKILFAVTFLHNPVFVPISDEQLATLLKVAQPRRGESIVDLGSGDGKIVLELAKQGLEATGVEINPLLVRASKKRADKLGLSHLAMFKQTSFWKIDFSHYDLILMYGTSYIMEKLERKALAEMKPGARFVSMRFKFPQWQPETEKNDVRVYIQPRKQDS